jgi:uncharacterized protein YigA (DUF484 family)
MPREKNKMQDWQQRVVVEKKELDAKREKLRLFSRRSEFSELAPEDQQLLAVQFDLMKAYSDILGQRIERFQNASA